jgi:hypothetical protein
VTAGSLLPYLPLLSLNHIYITDDVFASDIFNGELPVRALAGRLVAAGQAPVWSSSLCSGMPLSASGVIEPLSFGLFAALSPTKALCILIVACVLVAAHGAYTLALRLGAERAGACLAGIAYAGSGYLVTQLKHLGIISTVVWLPWGLLLLDRALAPTPAPRVDGAEKLAPPPDVWSRLRDVGLFGLVYAEQVLSGFPQSAYISGLVYAVWAFVLLVRVRGRVGTLPLRVVLAFALALAVLLAVSSGAVALLPLVELGSTSDRSGNQSWQFASMLPYSWSDALNFLLPYANGNVADGTYHGSGFFWENYGYVGAMTFMLAFFALVRGIRRPRVLLLFCIGIGAFSLVLGANTPVYYWAWKHLPGMDYFRFPTRFLFVVDLVLCILGGIGLGLLRPMLARSLARAAPRVVCLVPSVFVLGTALDLFARQSQQNPFVPSSEWLAKPSVVVAMGDAANEARLFSPLHNHFHGLAYKKAHGWADLNPYRDQRETVAPNTGAFWGVATADCYMGIAPSWYVDVWGDHSRRGLVVPATMSLGKDAIVANPSFAPVLGSYGVTHLASPVPIRGATLQELPGVAPIHLYRLPGKRARVVPVARIVQSNHHAAAILTRPGFDPDGELLLHAPTPVPASALVNGPTARGEAWVVKEDSRHLRVQVDAPEGGYLLLADNFYPGWHASVDGTATTLFRANVSSRAVRLPRGSKTVDFYYEAAPFFKGLRITGASAILLLAWLMGSSFLVARRRLHPIAAHESV